MVHEAKVEFWDRWVNEVFLSQLKQMKWFKYKQNVLVGDVVFRRMRQSPDRPTNTFMSSKGTVVQTD
jgi:hypothetical protein